MTPSKLQLYYFESCPYCQLVLNVIKDLGIKVTYCDTLKDPQHREKLIKDTGRQTVPCLYIDEVPMHESRDIMAWLKQNAANLPKE